MPILSLYLANRLIKHLLHIPVLLPLIFELLLKLKHDFICQIYQVITTPTILLVLVLVVVVIVLVISIFLA